jgi:hypothetical protein
MYVEHVLCDSFAYLQLKYGGRKSEVVVSNERDVIFGCFQRLGMDFRTRR